MVPCTDPSEWGENHVCVCVCVCVCVLISRVFPSISATVTVFVSTDTMQEKKKSCSIVSNGRSSH